jgi:hypothetical protein
MMLIEEEWLLNNRSFRRGDQDVGSVGVRGMLGVSEA